MLLENKVAVITGSAVGIGRGIAIALAREGANIIALDINALENHTTAAEVKAAGQECLALACDVGDKVQVRHAINEGLAAFGRIDVLINNAAVWDDSSLLGGTYESQTAAYDNAMGSCALGAYYCARACAPAMVASGGGNIINVITEHVKEGHYITEMPALGYDCAKFAQWRQIENWAHELKDSGIRANGLCFGATDTPMFRNAVPTEGLDTMKPEDLGQAVLNILAQGPAGDTGHTYLFGTSGTPRAESLRTIAGLSP